MAGGRRRQRPVLSVLVDAVPFSPVTRGPLHVNTRPEAKVTRFEAKLHQPTIGWTARPLRL